MSNNHLANNSSFGSISNQVPNGRDLAAYILNHPNGGLEALLHLAESQENEWLEFKAALHPEGGVFRPEEKKEDYQWHVAKAVIALANWSGEAVILGIDDGGKPIGLEASDPGGVMASKGREAFNREIVKSAVARKQWNTGRSGIIEMDEAIDHLIDLQNDTYQGLPVAVILVSPAPENELLEISERRQDNRKRYLTLVRDRGAVGRVRELQSKKDIRACGQARKQYLDGYRYQQYWETFLSSLGQSTDDKIAETIDPEVEKALLDYCRNISRSLSQLTNTFVPLDADEEQDDTLEYAELDAEELPDLFDSDDPWDEPERSKDTDKFHEPALEAGGDSLCLSGKPA